MDLRNIKGGRVNSKSGNPFRMDVKSLSILNEAGQVGR